MLKFSSIISAVIILLICCLLFVNRWFHSELNLSFSIGYLVFGLPLFAATVALGLHIWRRNASQQLRGEISNVLHRRQSEGENIRIAPFEVLDSMHIYNDISLRNYWSYRVLGVINLASSLLLAVMLGTDISVGVAKILAFVSSLSTGIIFSFNLVEKSNRARRAFRILLNAVMLYQHGKIEMEELLERYSQAEDHLGEDEFKSGTGENVPTTK
ncbi:MAG: hypothetical protein ACRYFR_14790 [Janthinobacterium lividum]